METLIHLGMFAIGFAGGYFLRQLINDWRFRKFVQNFEPDRPHNASEWRELRPGDEYTLEDGEAYKLTKNGQWEPVTNAKTTPPPGERTNEK